MYEEITKLIENNEFDKALARIEKLQQNDPKKYNLTGLVYFNKRELDKAKEAFEKGLKIAPIDSDLLFNYGYLLKELGQEMEAWRYLMRIHNKDWATYDLLGDIEYKNRSKVAAIRFYKKAAELTNNEEMKRKFLAIQESTKSNMKIAFLCLPGLDNFLKDIVEAFSLAYDVRLVVTSKGEEIAEAIRWADIVWLEWANEMAVFATNKVPEILNKKVVCRLHSYEVFTPLPEQINWNNVDNLIFVSKHIRRIFDELHPNAKVDSKKEAIVPNGVNLDRFKFSVHKPGYNLAVVAHINYKKDPAMWIQIMAKLSERDKRYKLNVAGDFQELRYKVYFEHITREIGIKDNLILHGWVEDVDKFLEDKNYVLSASIHEGHPYNILESMARGIKPIIHNYVGAKEQWPKELIYNTIDEAVQKIMSEDYDSESYRRFIEDNYSLERQISEIEEIMRSVLTHYSAVDQVHINNSKSKRMKIAIASSDNSIKIKSGGKHVHQELLYKGLRELEVDVERVYFDSSSYAITVPLYSLNLLNDHSTLFKAQISGIMKYFSERSFSGYNLVHSHDVISANGIQHENILLTVHGYFSREAFDYSGVLNMEDNRELYEWTMKIEKEAVSKAKKIIAVDSRIKNYLIDNLKVESSKVIVLHNAIDEDIFAPVDEKMKVELRKKLGIPEKAFVVFLPRRFVPKNGVLYAAEAFSKLKSDDYFFVIAGRGLLRDQMLEVLSGNRNLMFLENLPHELIADYYKASDVVLVPSITSNNVEEATSLSMLEGMACGKVTICSGVGGMKEVIRNMENGILIEQKSVQAIINAIVYAKENWDSLENVRLNARKCIIEKHSYRLHTQKILEIYKSML